MSADYTPVLDPVRHTRSRIPLPVRDPNTPYAAPQMVRARVAVLGRASRSGAARRTCTTRCSIIAARLWLTSRVAPQREPGVLQRRVDASVREAHAGGATPAASSRCTIRRRRRSTLIDTCFGTHHLFFAEDANHTLWTSSGGGGGVVGWLNTKMFDETGDEERSQGWTALVLDTNGNGRRDAYIEADQPVDPAKDSASTRRSTA